MYDPGGTYNTSPLTNYEKDDDEPDISKNQDECVLLDLTNDNYDVSGLWYSNLASVKTDLLKTSHGARATRDHSPEEKEAVENPFFKENTDRTSGLTLFDPGGNHDKDLLLMTDLDHTLSSPVTTLVLDPGGSNLKDLDKDLSTFTTDISMPNTELLATDVLAKSLDYFKQDPRTVFDPGGGQTSVD